ncbi:hypothetical protein ACQYWQ_06985 [Streptomyces sp. P6-2-1]|uniref:hypothetical protein n=1 Tax=unclassified Streptomyces TaxID=2593676 RepID=UPI003D368761
MDENDRPHDPDAPESLDYLIDRRTTYPTQAEEREEQEGLTWPLGDPGEAGGTGDDALGGTGDGEFGGAGDGEFGGAGAGPVPPRPGGGPGTARRRRPHPDQLAFPARVPEQPGPPPPENLPPQSPPDA